LLHPNNHPQDSDLVDVDEQGCITAFYPYPHEAQRYFPNLVNAALYVFEKTALEDYQELKGALDFGKHLFPKMLLDGKKLYGYRSPEYIKDAGTPERLDQVEADFQAGRIQYGSFAHPAPAVFLDRDGTLNIEKNHIRAVAELELIPHVAQAVRRLNDSHYRTIIITNQPVIARGDCSVVQLKEIHNKLETLLGQEGAYVNAIYYCPHHPDRGFPGERAELKILCSCRKPAPGLIEQATQDLHLDREQSWFIGDSTVDIMTAQNAGLKSILVRTGHAGGDNTYRIKADFEFFDLNRSVDFIIDVFPEMFRQATTMVRTIQPGDRLVIGGLARSGKSTWASVFRYAIQALGLRAIVVPLDCWLKSVAERGTTGVLARYDVAGIQAFLTALDHAADVADLVLPYYDRMSRTQNPIGQLLTIKKSDIIILDGVIALMHDDFVRRATLKLFVEGNETQRREIFWAEYRARGFPEAEIETIYWQRQIDEVPPVLDSRRYADMIIQGVST
jgi:histidinol-phosphate phosphatase family protein